MYVGSYAPLTSAFSCDYVCACAATMNIKLHTSFCCTIEFDRLVFRLYLTPDGTFAKVCLSITILFITGQLRTHLKNNSLLRYTPIVV